jgi:hypothetical protein
VGRIPRVVAYVHGPERVRVLGRAFKAGCERHGIPCEVREVGDFAPADVVWLYGLGPALPAFEAHPGSVRLVADKGYFAEYAKGEKYFRVSVNAQQPDAHLRLRPHPSDRWEALGIEAEPVKKRGDYILLCGMGPKQAARHGYGYGQWERERLRTLPWPTLVREKPKNPPIDGIRSQHKTTSEAIRGARVVVCKTGNIGVDCLLHGVPVVCDSGPGLVYYPERRLDAEPIADRLQALADVAYWQWTAREIEAGDFWRHLKDEGFV